MYSKQVVFVVCLFALQGNAFIFPDVGTVFDAGSKATSTINDLINNVSNSATTAANESVKVVHDTVNIAVGIVDGIISSLKGDSKTAQNLAAPITSTPIISTTKTAITSAPIISTTKTAITSTPIISTTKTADETTEGRNNFVQSIQCIIGLRNNLLDLPRVVISNIFSCIKEEANKAIQTLKNTLNLITNTTLTFQNLNKEFSDGNVLQKPFVAAKAIAGVPQAIALITKQVLDITSFVTTVQSNLSICAVTKVVGLQRSIVDILRSVADC